MPSLDAPESIAGRFAKIMLIGDSGTGKTGSLISLLEAGYHLHFIDMDNGLKFIANWCRKNRPDLLSKVDYVYCRDKYYPHPTEGMKFKPPASAYIKASRLLDKWEDGSEPSKWGESHVLVVDSLTYLGYAALNQAYTLMPASASGAKPNGMQIYGMAGEAISNFMMAVMGENFGTNVILITHISYQDLESGARKGLPTTIGQKASEKAPGLFNDMFLCEQKGTGDKVRRVIRCVPNPTIDAKTSALDLPPELPLETGMATIFEALRGKL